MIVIILLGGLLKAKTALYMLYNLSCFLVLDVAE